MTRAAGGGGRDEGEEKECQYIGDGKLEETKSLDNKRR